MEGQRRFQIYTLDGENIRDHVTTLWGWSEKEPRVVAQHELRSQPDTVRCLGVIEIFPGTGERAKYIETVWR